MRRSMGILVLMMVTAGCLSAPTPSAVLPVPPGQLAELTGAWQGWLVTERSFALFDLEINGDGTFEVTGPWTSARGVLVLADDVLRFDGSGLWRGTLSLDRRSGERILKLERDDRLVRGFLHPINREG